MRILLYAVSKRHNSTMIAGAISQKDIPNTLIENDATINSMADINNMTLVMADKDNKLFMYNYCYIEKFYRFYYINKWTIRPDGMYIAECACDLFATFAQNIRESGGYVVRQQYLNTDSVYSDQFAYDTFYPASIAQQVVTTEGNMSATLSPKPNEGIFVISVLSTQTPVYGAVNYYILTASQFATLVNNMVRTATGNIPTWSSASLSQDVLKELCSPMQYITSCRWFPLKVSVNSNIYHQEGIYLGMWNSGALGYKIVSDVVPDVSATGFYDIPVPNQAHYIPYSEGGYYPLYAPYANYTLINPLIGTVELDSTTIAYAVSRLSLNNELPPQLKLLFKANLITGTARFTLQLPVRTSTAIIFKTQCVIEKQLACDIPLATITTNYVSGLQNSVKGIASASTSGLSGNIGGVVDGIFDAARAVADTFLNPSVQSTGVSGQGYFEDIDKIIIQGTFRKTVPTSNVFGRAAFYEIDKIDDVVVTDGGFKASYFLFKDINLLQKFYYSINDPSGRRYPVMSNEEKEYLENVMKTEGVFVQ